MSKQWAFRMLFWVAVMAVPLVGTARSGEPIAFGIEVVLGLLLARALAMFDARSELEVGQR